VHRFVFWLTILWQLFTLAVLGHALFRMRPFGVHFSHPSAWRPVDYWLRAGTLFHFSTGRAAILFLVVLFFAGCLVLMLYIFDRPRGWWPILLWNALGALNYAAPRTEWLCAAFVLVMVLLTVSAWRR
jgi:hypothetical protein